MTERQTNTQDRARCPQHDPRLVASRKTAHFTCNCARPAADALAALERARRVAFEAQEAERWDGLS